MKINENTRIFNNISPEFRCATAPRPFISLDFFHVFHARHGSEAQGWAGGGLGGWWGRLEAEESAGASKNPISALCSNSLVKSYYK